MSYWGLFEFTMKTKNILILFIFLCIGCENDLNIRPTNWERKLVIKGVFLSQRDNFVGISNTYYPYSDSRYYKIDKNYLTVRITYKGNSYTLQETPDSLQPFFNSSDYYFMLPKSDFVMPDSGVLTLDVFYKDKHVFANCEIPDKIPVQKFEEDFVNKITKLTAKFPQGISYLLIRDKWWSLDAPQYHNLHKILKIIGDGTEKNIDIQGIYPENIFSFWIISKEFYEFLRAKEKHIENQEDKYFFGNPIIEVPTNIKGGFGFFTVLTEIGKTQITP